MIEANLDAPNVPTGEANIAYSTHPAHRGNGVASRAVRLVLRFLAENTAANQAHFLIDPANTASRRVATTVGAERVGSALIIDNRLVARHVVALGNGEP